MTNRYDEKERRIHCAFSEKCGGCDYAGMKYDNELAVKQKYIEELFGEYVKVDDIVGMYRPIYITAIKFMQLWDLMSPEM